MKKRFGFISILFLAIIGYFILQKPVDIRNGFLKQNISEVEMQKGIELLHKVQEAYGGKANWDTLSSVEFVQTADWYNKTKLSGWDVNQQLFQMNVSVNSDDAQLELLNGPNKGQQYKLERDRFSRKISEVDWQVEKANRIAEKMLFKNYWFQFPFRISEASIIQYAGQAQIKGIQYELLFATWQSEKANKEYDQFLLYINEESYLIEYLKFTVRDKLKGVSFTSSFDNFQSVDGFTFPFAQYISKGKPGKRGIRLHENIYQHIEVN